MYAILKRNENGILVGLNDSMMSMCWLENSICVWKEPPTHYFKPEEGHFIVKTTKHYKDIYFTGKPSGYRRNKQFLLK